jgi:hypothetical protein
MSTRSALTLALAVLILVPGVAGVVPGIAGSADPGLAPQPATDAEVEYDSTLLRVDLREDGTATWTIEYRVDLDDENTTDAFESLGEEIEANRSAFEDQFADRMNRTARTAENATGREMAIRNVSVETRRDEIQQVGVVAYTFAWTNFGAADGDELRAGDAIAGFVLDSGTTLFVTWPDGYGPVDVTPEPDELRGGSASWIGPETFTSEQPRLVLERGADTPTSDGLPDDGTTAPPPGGDTTTAPPGEGGLDPFLVGAVAVLLLAVAAGAWYVRERGGGAAPGATPGGDDGGPAGGESTPAAGERAASAGEPDGQEAASAGGAATGTPEALLSNEERVLRLLEDNGGRMKQQQVVQKLDWTDAKTSQVVGTLRDDGEIEVFRIGRENVLALPGETEL